MDYSSIFDIYCAFACFTFILAGVFCGVVRWCHMCRPYDEQGSYFYPARRQATFFFSAVVMQFPYLLHPSDPDTWLYIRIFGIIYYPVCFASLFLRYFREKGIKCSWWGRFYFALPMLLLSVMLQFVLFHNGNFPPKAEEPFLYVMGVFSILLTCRFVKVAHWLKKKIDRYHNDNYSNESDFPYRFAEKVIYSPLVWIVVMWLLFITGSREVKIFIDLALAAWMVFFLTRILHPQRILRPQDVEQEIMRIEDEEKMRMEVEKVSDNKEEEQEQNCNPEKMESVRKELLTVIRRRYKDSNLTRAQVIGEIEYGNRTLAGNIISEIGFYNLVNLFRIEHARLYKEANPAATQDNIAEESGYKDRFALNYAKKKVSKIDFPQEWLTTNIFSENI